MPTHDQWYNLTVQLVELVSTFCNALIQIILFLGLL